LLLAKVRGPLVSTVKNSTLANKKLLVVEEIDLDGNLTGKQYLAIDTVSAGVSDTVLIIKEGASANQILNEIYKDKACKYSVCKYPVQVLIVGIVDKIELLDNEEN